MRKKVAVLGATGMMGQTFLRLLWHHPWFQVSAIAASEKSVGKSYPIRTKTDAQSDTHGLQDLHLVEPKPKAVGDAEIVFSALPTEAASSIEEDFARAGYPVFSNASSHRMDTDVPLLNPEVNGDHCSLVEEQKRRRKWDGFIITNPNCTTAILTLSLKPLQDQFGLDTVIVSSMQAISGAGYPGVASFDILENVIPFIPKEEEKVQQETNKILGSHRQPSKIVVSASCHRVPTVHGHLEAVFAKTKSPTTPRDAVNAMREFKSAPQRLKLPSSPAKPIVVREEEDRPQTRLDVEEGAGMSVTVGRVREDSALNGLKYIVLGHNLIRGGAGCSILNAELAVSKKIIK